MPLFSVYNVHVPLLTRGDMLIYSPICTLYIKYKLSIKIDHIYPGYIGCASRGGGLDTEGEWGGGE
jgi:hypothetical protein